MEWEPYRKIVMSNGETLNNRPEKGIEPGAALVQLEKLGDKIQGSQEKTRETAESRAERAKNEALETAISVDKKNEAEKETTSPKATIRHGVLTKKELNSSYKKTMTRVQDEMSYSGRIFSKLIHNKTVEKTSEIVGSSIARPNAILSGSVVAFLLTLIMYIVSKNNGYTMSGFETIAFFAIGWAVGLTYDYLRILFTGKKS